VDKSLSLVRDVINRFDPPDLLGSLEEKVEKVMLWCHESGGGILEVSNLLMLSEIPNPPTLLFYRGNAKAIVAPCVGVVGARKSSAAGVRAAMHISRDLSRAGVCVVSGLARGIDSAAHRGAISGSGMTIAVLGHGLDRVYPTENRDLAYEILSRNGCLLSEYPPGLPPLKHHFPERNRIISGLSRGVLVVEAAEKSGSLITAKHALEQNRDVFACPGTFDDQGFFGNHKLIQEGAKLVFSAQDILEEYPDIINKSEKVNEELRRLAPLQQTFKYLSNSGSLEELFLASQLSFEELLKFLDEAKKEGAVVEVAPQRFSWIGPELG
jgi:DNA processing protein